MNYVIYFMNFCIYIRVRNHFRYITPLSLHISGISCQRQFQRLVRTDIVALGEDSMSVQYLGCCAAILGVIHHHCSDTSFNFTPEIYSRIESQKGAFALCYAVRLMIQINEEVRVNFFPIQFYVGTRGRLTYVSKPSLPISALQSTEMALVATQ